MKLDHSTQIVMLCEFFTTGISVVHLKPELLDLFEMIIHLYVFSPFRVVVVPKKANLSNVVVIRDFSRTE